MVKNAKALGQALYERKTQPVNAFPTGASPYGVMDMVGNVQEWTLDRYVPYPGHGEKSSDPANPGGRSMSSAFPPTHSVVRGGSFATVRSFCRCSARIPVSRDSRLPDLSFRCVYTPDPVAEVGKALESGNSKEALRLMRKALTLSPHHPDVLYNTAMAYQLDEQFSEAAKLWETLLMFWSEKEDARQNLALCRERS